MMMMEGPLSLRELGGPQKQLGGLQRQLGRRKGQLKGPQFSSRFKMFLSILSQSEPVYTIISNIKIFCATLC